MKEDVRALKQQLEQTQADLRTAQISLGAANREIEALENRIKVLSALNPDETAPRRGRPPKQQ